MKFARLEQCEIMSTLDCISAALHPAKFEVHSNIRVAGSLTVASPQQQPSLNGHFSKAWSEVNPFVLDIASEGIEWNANQGYLGLSFSFFFLGGGLQLADVHWGHYFDGLWGHQRTAPL